MSKPVPSRKRNAPAQGRSNFKDARSQTSARKKSGRSSEQSLQVRTPQNSEWLSRSGVIVPDGLDPGEETIALDFTTVSARHVGAIHSRFSVRHAHALYIRAGLATRLLRLKRKHRIELAKHRVRHSAKFKTAKALEEDFSLNSGAKLEETILGLEVKAQIMDSVIEGFMDIVKAASREMTRRDSERAQTD